MYIIDIKEFRRKNNLTQKELADYLGVTQAFISNMEAGRDKVPDRYISKILGNPNFDTSAINAAKDSERPADMIVSREVFEKISKLIDTVCSQQNTIADQHRTIDRLISSQKNSSDVRTTDNADSAVAG